VQNCHATVRLHLATVFASKTAQVFVPRIRLPIFRGGDHAIDRRSPLWGALRIHDELLKLGIDVGQTTVPLQNLRIELIRLL
jgi:hypothetical protein